MQPTMASVPYAGRTARRYLRLHFFGFVGSRQESRRHAKLTELPCPSQHSYTAKSEMPLSDFDPINCRIEYILDATKSRRHYPGQPQYTVPHSAQQSTPQPPASSSVNSFRPASDRLGPAASMHGPRRQLPSAAKSAKLLPPLRFLFDGTARHANVLFRDAAQLNNARHEFQRILRDQGRQVLYLHDMHSLGDFEETVKVKNGQLKLKPGPFNKLLDTGGTLILNAANFSPQHLEAFNALLTDRLWQGKKLKRPVQLIFLSDTATMRNHVLSGAQISRVAFRDLSDVDFPDKVDPPIETPMNQYEADVRIIDFKSEAQWRDLAFGTPQLRPDGKWMYRPGFADTPAHGTLVLRNAPKDTYFMDMVHDLSASGVRVRLEEGIPTDRFRTRIENKYPYEGDIARENAESVCIVNASNIELTLNPHHGVSPPGLTLHPSLLEQVSRRLGEGRLPVVHVCETLPERHWDRLMMYQLRFDVVASPGVEVPNKYKTRVATLSGPRLKGGMPVFDHAALGTQPVTFLLSADSALVDFPAGARHIFITPAMRADTLMCGVERTKPTTICEFVAAGTLQPNGVTLKEGQLLADLRQGRTVFLQGQNPALEDDLATLLHWPHYYNAPDGRLWHFGEEGGLTGRLIFVTPNQDRLDRHALTPACSDGILDRQQWTDAMIRKLAAAFPALARQGHGNIDDLLRRTVCFFNTLTHQGLLPAAEHPVSYRTVEKLFRHLDPDLRAPAGRVDPKLWDRIRVLVFKDMLLADHRQSDQTSEEFNFRLKVILKALFPEQTSEMPPRSVNLQRLEDLLERINHPHDIRDNACRFLNVFSPDVIGDIIGLSLPLPERVELPADIEDLVQAWLHAQAPLLKSSSRQLVLDFGAGVRPNGADEAAPARLQSADNALLAALPPEQKIRLKTAMALRQSGALFEKGPPGSGKSASTKQIAPQLVRADIASIASPAYDNELDRWARDPGHPVLVVDEANLIPVESSHDALKAKFVDGTIVVKGERRNLHPNKWVVFTGNADNLPGRMRSQMAAESFITQYFKPMKPAQLQTNFVDPLLDRAGHNALLAQHVVSIHIALHHAYPDRNLSPRNLEEYVSQVLCHLSRRPEAERQVQALGPWMIRLAMHVYGGILPPEDAPVIESWLRRRLDVPADAPLPALPNVNLNRSSLLATESTQALADTVHWWLESQRLRYRFNPERNVLGQRALLIEGPASRGKDTVVEAVLNTAGIKYLRVNADPNSLKHLQAALKDACRNGKVLLVDELSNLPPGILEGELNAVLAGDSKVHNKFALIATVNPGEYAGRKPLSPALLNRMLKVVVGDYAPDELRHIAHHFAANLFTRQRRTLNLAAIPAADINMLVNMHLNLVNLLGSSPHEFKPKLRELFRALEYRFSHPRNDVQTAFDDTYAYYQSQANLAGGSVLHARQADKTDWPLQLERQLQRALMLAYPDWLSWPATVADDAIPPRQPVRYDAEEHCLRFNPHLELDRLCAVMLQLLQPGLRNLHRHPPAVQAPATARAAEAADAAGGATRMEAHNFNPSVMITSGTGDMPKEGDIGQVTNRTEDVLYLEFGRRTLRNEIIKFPRLKIKGKEPAHFGAVPNITLRDVYINKPQPDDARVYLLATSNTRPDQISLDSVSAGPVHRDGRGGWYVNTNTTVQIIGRVEYSLVPHHEAREGSESGKQAYPFFSGLKLSSAGSQPMRAILTLAGEVFAESETAPRPRREIANALINIFQNPAWFEYSEEDAHALNSTNDIAARCQRFLEQRQGMCFEYAYTCAAVLEQVFQIPARICRGYQVALERIPAVAHAWLEFENENGEWTRIDPTPFAPEPEPAHLHESAALRARSAAVSSVNTIFQTKNFWTLSPKHLQIPDNMLKRHFDLGSLNLLYWDTELAMRTYNAVAGKLDLRRFMQGKPDFYLDTKPITTMKYRAIHIENLPWKQDEGAWAHFFVRMIRPIQALINSGVPIHYYGSEGELVRLEQAHHIQHACEISASSFRARSDDESTLRINADSENYLDRVAATYYEAVLKSGNVDRNDDRAAVDCLISELWLFVENLSKRQGGLPLQIPLHGKTLTITREAVAASNMARLNSQFVKDLTQAVGNLIAGGMSDPREAYRLFNVASNVFVAGVTKFRPTPSTKLQLIDNILTMVCGIDHTSNPNDLIASCMNIVFGLNAKINASDINAMASPPASGTQWLALFLAGHLANSEKKVIDEAIDILSRFPKIRIEDVSREEPHKAMAQLEQRKFFTTSQRTALLKQCHRLFN